MLSAQIAKDSSGVRWHNITWGRTENRIPDLPISRQVLQKIRTIRLWPTASGLIHPQQTLQPLDTHWGTACRAPQQHPSSVPPAAFVLTNSLLSRPPSPSSLSHLLSPLMWKSKCFLNNNAITCLSRSGGHRKDKSKHYLATLLPSTVPDSHYLKASGRRITAATSMIEITVTL